MDIKTINFMGVNCYLLKSEDNFLLIDTGFYFKRRAMDRELEKYGVRAENLKLIIITHADLDHTGGCCYLREKYGVKIAVHPEEARSAATGNMAANRGGGIGVFGKKVFSLFSIFIRSSRFEPDLNFEDGQDLSEYGFDAKVLHLPGHSRGSIGVLTGDGALFCGDLLANSRQPFKNKIVDNRLEMDASIERLKELDVKIIYPGHGNPFTMEDFIRHNE